MFHITHDYDINENTIDKTEQIWTELWQETFFLIVYECLDSLYII